MWAKLQLDHLLSLERRSAIEKALANLPEDLQQTYNSMFEDIRRDRNGMRDVGLRAIRWLLSQNGVATSRTMRSAVCYNTEEKEKVNFDIDSDALLSACQNLVVIVESREEKDDEFRFAHLSVQEYCETSLWSPENVHAFAAKICLTRLLDWETLEPFQRSEEDPRYVITHRYLSDYAAQRWIYHIQQHSNSIADKWLIALLEEFLGRPGNPSAAYDKWRSRMISRSQSGEDAMNLCALCPKGRALFIDVSAANRLRDLIPLKGIQTNSSNQLQVSEVECQATQVLRTFLPSFQRQTFNAWLKTVAVEDDVRSAVDIRQVCIQKVFMELSHDVDDVSTLRLHRIPNRKSWLKHLDSCDCIIDAITECFDGSGMSRNWNGPIMLALMQYLSPYSTPDSGTPLPEKIVELGGDFDSKTVNLLHNPENWRRPVAAAIHAGSPEALDYILKHGAVADSADLLLAIALARSPSDIQPWGRPRDSTCRIVRTLIDHGCDVNLNTTRSDGAGLESVEGPPTPIIAAAAKGLGDVCRVLCEHGAIVNFQVPHGKYSPALLAAVRGGCLDTTRVPHALGADPIITAQE